MYLYPLFSFSYDEENRLVTAGSVNYTYDLLGRRLSRTYNNSTTTYVWDGAHIIAEYTDGSLTKKYIYGPGMDNPVAMVNVSGQTEDWYYYYADALGSIRLLTNGGGTIVESYTYITYGQPHVMNTAGTDGNWLTSDGVTTYDYSGYDNPYMFTARRWDSIADIYYYRFRDYSPLIGRFLQTDPLHYWDTMNLYQYCFNNPIRFLDPYGLGFRDWLKKHSSVISITGGIVAGFGLVVLPFCPPAGIALAAVGGATAVIGIWGDSYIPKDATEEVVEEGHEWHERTYDKVNELFDEDWKYDEKPEQRDISDETRGSPKDCGP